MLLSSQVLMKVKQLSLKCSMHMIAIYFFISLYLSFASSRPHSTYPLGAKEPSQKTPD